MINKKSLKTKVCMCNTIRDVALTNSRETSNFRDFVQYPKQKFFAFSRLRECLEHVLLRTKLKNFRHIFQYHVLLL